MNLLRSFIYTLFFVGFTPIFLYADGTMVIRGAIMRYDTTKGITTAEGGDGMATAIFNTNEVTKKLEAKIIRAKMNDTSNSSNDIKSTPSNNTFSNDIEWVEAVEHVHVTFPDRTMTADRCIMQNKVIHCYGTVTITAGKNHVKGDEGTFDMEHDRYEIFTSKDGAKHVEATIHPEKKSITKDGCE
jgi:hypothetical protein